MAAKVLLLVIQPRNVTTGARVVVRLAGGGAKFPYRYANNNWRAGLTSIPTIGAQLDFDGKNLALGAIPQALTLEWNPSSDAAINEMAALHWKDAPFTLYLGDENEAGVLPPVLITGTCMSHKITDSVLQLAMADPAASLKRPILVDTFKGTGGLEGPADWKGRRKRRVWGYVFDVEGEPVDPANNIYCFSDPWRPLYGFPQVRDKGAVAASTTTLAWQGSVAATFAALQAAAAPNGGGVICPSIGCVKWWTRPAGALCADIQGEAVAYNEYAAGIVSQILSSRAGPPLNAASYANANIIRPNSCGYVADDLDTEISAAMDFILGGNSLLWVLDATTGKIRIEPWTIGASVASFRADHSVRVNAFPPLKSRRIGYRRNHRVHSPGDIAAILTYGDGTPIDEYQTAITNALTLPAGQLKGDIWGGASTIPISMLLESALVGKSLSLDPDFSRGVLPSTFYTYNNSGGANITQAVVTLPDAPNGSGKVLRVSYNGGGVVSPGFGGTQQRLDGPGDTVSSPGKYAKNTYIAYIIRALIPVGRSLNFSGNPTGAEGGFYWVTPTAGTGDWATYIGILKIGLTGTFSNTGHLYITGGADVAFNWDIARYEQRELASAALPQIARLVDGLGSIRSEADLITLLGTAASITGQGPGATAIGTDVLNNTTADGVTRIARPVGGTIQAGAGQTGAIRISTPLTQGAGVQDAMLRFFVDIYEFATGALQTYQVQCYTNNGTAQWFNVSASVLGAGPVVAKPVRFGISGGKWAVWIGDPGSTWAYPAIVVRDVQVSYVNNSIATWASGWAMSFDTNAATSVTGTVANPVAGDSIFGLNARETWGGALATLNNFKTGLGSAATIANQGPGATAPSSEVLNWQSAGGITKYNGTPGGGLYSGSGTVNGVLRIEFPVPWSNTMIQFEIEIYDYQLGATVRYFVGGYTYAATPEWINYSASYIGPEGKAKPVRFGTQSGRAIVWIGDIASVWQYPQVSMSNLQMGYSSTAIANWSSGWVISINTFFNGTVQYEVLKPRAGDAVFGEGVFEAASGALATLANFKTAVGTAAAFLGQGALAIKNWVDLATTDVLPRGSIPPMFANNGFSYTSTTTTINFTWPSMTVYRPDGTSISISSGSQNVTGLSSSTTFKVYPYIVDNGGGSATVEFVTSGGSPVYGTPAILYASGGNVQAAAGSYLQGRIPMGTFTAATTTSGGGGGGGGGWNCIHEDVLVRNGRAGDLRIGDTVDTPDGSAVVEQVVRATCSRWIEVWDGETLLAKVTEGHLFYRAGDGSEVAAKDLRLGDLLRAADRHVEVNGLTLCTEPATAVGIGVAEPHLHFLGQKRLLCHNGTQKP